MLHCSPALEGPPPPIGNTSPTPGSGRRTAERKKAKLLSPKVERANVWMKNRLTLCGSSEEKDKQERQILVQCKEECIKDQGCS